MSYLVIPLSLDVCSSSSSNSSSSNKHIYRLLLRTLILDIDNGIMGLRSEQIVLPYPQHNGEWT